MVVCEGGTQVDHQHQGGDGIPTRAQALGTPGPPGHPNLPAAHGQEGPGELGREPPLHAPSGAGGGGTYLPHSTCADPGGDR